jgi:hypothetical protein
MFDADVDFKYAVARDLNEYNGSHLIDYRIYLGNSTYYTLGLNVIMCCPKITDLNGWYDDISGHFKLDDESIIFLSDRLNSENNSLLYNRLCGKAAVRPIHMLDYVQGKSNVTLKKHRRI